MREASAAVEARAAEVGRGLLEVHGAHVQLAAVGLRERLAADTALVRLHSGVTLHRNTFINVVVDIPLSFS